MSKKKREKKLLPKIKASSKKRRAAQPLIPFFDRSAFADIEAPKGFRPVTATQALVEFAEPLRESIKDEELEEINKVLNLAMQIWNFTNPKVLQKPSPEEIIEQIGETLGIDEIDAAELFDRMVERKAYLFPDEIQPDDPMTRFMRKEVDYLIAKFDEAQLNMSEEPIPPDRNDQKVLADLRRLDQALANGEEYAAWEKLYFSVEKACCNRYYEWLKAKGVPEEYCQRLPFCVETYLNFIYRYQADTLLGITDFEVEEFFMDHLLRKVIIHPHDYVYWPPALRLFSTFLSEKGYLADPQPFIDLFDEIEPEFIEVLKRHY
jgi:hypothetical protein